MSNSRPDTDSQQQAFEETAEAEAISTTRAVTVVFLIRFIWLGDVDPWPILAVRRYAVHPPERKLSAAIAFRQPRLPVILPLQRGIDLHRTSPRLQKPRRIRAQPALGVGAQPALLLVAQPGIGMVRHATCP